jgi:hypothetical protein
VVRADVEATDFAPILEMLTAITGLGVPGLPHRYIGLVLAGLRPGRGRAAERLGLSQPSLSASLAWPRRHFRDETCSPGWATATS